VNSSTILISLGISALATLVPASLVWIFSSPPAYSLYAQQDAIKSQLRERITDGLEISYPDGANGWGVARSAPVWFWHPGQMAVVKGAAEYLTEHLERKHRCGYCRTVQGIGAHCLNCGAPL